MKKILKFVFFVGLAVLGTIGWAGLMSLLSLAAIDNGSSLGSFSLVSFFSQPIFILAPEILCAGFAVFSLRNENIKDKFWELVGKIEEKISGN